MAYIGRDIEYGVLEKQTLTADSSTVAFDLTYFSDANGLIVSVGGIVQEPNVAYTVIGSTLTFTEAPTTGDTVYVVYLGQEMVVSTITPTDYMDYQVGTGDGSDTTPITTLNHSVSLAQDIMVTLNGIRQVPSTDYSVSGTTLTFTTAPADGVAILVYFLMLVRAEGTVVDNSVTDAKIVGMSGSKITTGTVPAGAVSNASIIGMDAAKLTGSFPNSLGADLSLSYQRLATLGLHVQNVNNKVAFNLTNSFLDSFEDSTGVDSTNSVNALVSSDEYVTSTSELDTATNIAPSSNDWDYTFAQSEWPVAGNPLGDHTSGGFIQNDGNDSGISSLHTFSGDFEIQFTMVEDSQIAFGVFDIVEDYRRAATSVYGMQNASTESFFFVTAGGTTKRFWHGNTDDKGSAYTWVDGSVVKITRVAGVITFYDDGVEAHEFTTTNSNTMRFFFSHSGVPYDAEIHDLTYTVPSTNVQYDGFFNETSSGNITFGGGVASTKYIGRKFRATSTGNISSINFTINAVTTNVTGCHAELWSDGTSPTAQIGSDSDSIAISTTGDKAFTPTDMPVVKGTLYWMVVADEGSGQLSWKQTNAGIPDAGSGNNTSIAGITDSLANEYAMEIAITPTGEPTPDHDTLLLIQSDTTNGSTTFTDSSQNGFTITVNGNTQHDTAQTLGFGTSSILFDGTGDYLGISHDNIFNFGTGDFTIDFIARFAATSKHQTVYAHGYGEAGSLLLQFNDAASPTLGVIVTSPKDLASTATATVNVDAHWAVVRLSGVLTIYKDGVAAGTVANTDSVSLTHDITIGGSNPEGYYFDGHLKEFRVSRVARWDANFTPPTSAYPTATATTLSATGTLISTASTADSAVSEVTGALLVKDSVGTNTLGTDLKAYFSSDNGSNWTEAASYDSSFTFDGTTKVIPLGKTTLSNTGTAVKMKVEWANQQASSKVAQLHGWAVNY